MNVYTQKILAAISFGMLLLGLYLLGSSKPHPVKRAVYYWKTEFSRSNWDTEPDSFLTRHQISKMYVKLLDVGYSEASGIYPVSKTRIDYYKQNDSLEYIPVVYISNAVLNHLASNQMDYYTKLFLQHALRLETYTGNKVNEIQIDCDWTEQTRDTYFELLRRMKHWAPQYQYSVTLRLYPFKYRQRLGIPPVNRVMLMLYNLENARNFETPNSIFNVNTAVKYLKDKSYPLPLDYAIPAFSWTLVFRNTQFLKVLSVDVKKEYQKLKDKYPGEENRIVLEDLGSGKYLVKEKPIGYNYFNLKAGDILKFETCGGNELKMASQLVQQMKPNSDATLSIFDFDMNDLNKISNEDIEAAYTLNY